ncbi:MAG: zinc ABC transporter substrate-binding protein [Verrucomicrobiota bacterium]
MRLFAVFLLILVVFPREAFSEEKLRVSTFSTILTEIAEQIGGDKVQVTGHVKVGIDPHDFEPKPTDLIIVAKADVILLSAKHMEGYVEKLKESTGTKGELVKVGDGFKSLKMEPNDDLERDVEDPHWWHSLANMAMAARGVRDAFIRARPNAAEAFRANAIDYLQRLDSLKKWAGSELAKLPRDQRKLVTSHDAFQYFAKENGFKVYAIEGISSSDQPSSKKVAQIIATVKAQGVKSIFSENIENPKVLVAITRETGAKLGGKLFADGLGENDAATYAGMYRHNVTTIVKGLQ